jgi:hypothetical protein
MARYVKPTESERRFHETRREAPRSGAQQAPRSREQDTGETLVDRLLQVAHQHLVERARKPVTDAGKLARALHLTSEQLEGNLGAPLLATAASGLDRAAALLDDDPRKLVGAVERFARTRSIAFCSGALVLGIGAGRFLKSSARTARHQPRDDEGTSHEPQ